MTAATSAVCTWRELAGTWPSFTWQSPDPRNCTRTCRSSGCNPSPTASLPPRVSTNVPSTRLSHEQACVVTFTQISIIVVVKRTRTNAIWQKAESLWLVRLTPRLYSPGGSIGLTVWLQFRIACFRWRFDPQISPSSIGQGPPSNTVYHWTPQV